MKKKIISLLLASLAICSLTACGKTETNSTQSTGINDAAIDVADIGTSNQTNVVVTEDENGETVVTNCWTPAAGRTGAYLDALEKANTEDNVKDILQYADIAKENGYTPYILLGTKINEDDSLSYAYSATNEFNKEVIVIVSVTSSGETTVELFEGTRDEIVGGSEDTVSDSNSKAGKTSAVTAATELVKEAAETSTEK